MVVFVGGIHGVGKTNFCQKLADLTGLRHRTVSEIINEESPSIDFDGSKKSYRLEENQRAFMNWLERNRDKNRLLLDGHFTLLDMTRQFYNVEINVFQHIRPSGLICLESPVDLVVSRLEKRDGQVWSRDLVRSMAINEKERAEFVATTLGVPVCILSSDDVFSAVNFVNKLME
ncbi:ATP-binding protein [Pseudomonas chlororaphis]|uniref:AAA family ATPase n=1 Tax=Pseudomonas chlororaphis TaxID=587753 RepID=A0AAP9VV63_9PSED|nr:ATP-binding protein [Pseudomonas chlororaphis]QNR48230.1 AAA family ATPase [Pseudomonas chlororaphis]